MTFDELLSQFASLCRDEGRHPHLQVDHIHQGMIAQTVNGLRYHLEASYENGREFEADLINGCERFRG